MTEGGEKKENKDPTMVPSLYLGHRVEFEVSVGPPPGKRLKFRRKVWVRYLSFPHLDIDDYWSQDGITQGDFAEKRAEPRTLSTKHLHLKDVIDTMNKSER